MIILQPVLGYDRAYYGNHREYPHGKIKKRKKLKVVWRKDIKISYEELESYNTSWGYIPFYGKSY